MNNNFSENLRKIRKDNNLSQEQLADELGVSRQAISKWESGAAYPEMDKIIALCEKFNVNMDDLLHKDIKEVKGEEETKKNINNYIDSFLKYITDTINMFSSMTFGSKLKCLLEQFLIIAVLYIISNIVGSFIQKILLSLINFLPGNVKYFINNIIGTILIAFFAIASVIILAHIFKTRYLDYYTKVKEDKANEKDNKEEEKEVNEEKDNKKLFKKVEDKIVIRDPKHTEYRFIKGLFKIIVLGIKFFVLLISIFLSLGLIGLFASLIGSFLLYKTGLFFVGLLVFILSCALMVTVFLVLFLNFVLSRKSDKKLLIIGFILSLVGIGIGSGLIGSGALNFTTGNDNEGMLKEETVEVSMNDKLFLYQQFNNIEYIEEKRGNLKLEYTYNENCDLNVEKSNEGNSIYAQVICKDTSKIGKAFVKNLNNKKIIPITSDIDSVKVYASKENIKKLKDNYNKYQEEVQKEVAKRDNLNIKVNELSEENKDLKNKINNLEKELSKYKNN